MTDPLRAFTSAPGSCTSVHLPEIRHPTPPPPPLRACQEGKREGKRGGLQTSVQAFSSSLERIGTIGMVSRLDHGALPHSFPAHSGE